MNLTHKFSLSFQTIPDKVLQAVHEPVHISPVQLNQPVNHPMNTQKPVVGQTITVYGQICTIVKVYRLGTVDVVSANGRYYRVTGLSFL